GDQLLDKVIHRLPGFHHQHNLARLGQRLHQLFNRAGTANTFALGTTGEEAIDLFHGAVVSGDGVAIAGHIKNKVFAHHGEAYQTYIGKWFHNIKSLSLWWMSCAITCKKRLMDADLSFVVAGQPA